MEQGETDLPPKYTRCLVTQKALEKGPRNSHSHVSEIPNKKGDGKSKRTATQEPWIKRVEKKIGCGQGTLFLNSIHVHQERERREGSGDQYETF